MITRSPAEIRAAKRAFRNLDRATQFRACCEIAETRAAELCLAYRNLVSVGYGYKTRGRPGMKSGRPGKTRSRPGKSIEQVIFSSPCIVFVVSRKWRSKARTRHAQRLPAEIYTYVASDGEQVLCAVPTDVKPLSAYGARARPHEGGGTIPPYGIEVSRSGSSGTVWGVAACAIERPAQPGMIYVLSCRHVLSMSLTGSEAASKCDVRAILDNSLLGSSVAVRGRLVGEPDASFDAQLAKVDNPLSLGSSLSGLRFDPAAPFAQGPQDVPARFWLLTPRRDAQGNRLKVWLESRDYVSKTLPYMGFNAVHHHLLHAVASARLGPGDSGSPAVPVAAGRQFLGMYIGGDGSNAYIIPAWQLLRGANYGLNGEKMWTVVNP